jgi:hypothetical protein
VRVLCVCDAPQETDALREALAQLQRDHAELVAAAAVKDAQIEQLVTNTAAKDVEIKELVLRNEGLGDVIGLLDGPREAAALRDELAQLQLHHAELVAVAAAQRTDLEERRKVRARARVCVRMCAECARGCAYVRARACA